MNSREIRPPVWMGVGIAVGAGIGAALDNIALGIGIGVAMGAAMMGLETRKKKEPGDSEPTDRS
jgi:hypothetical protein